MLRSCCALSILTLLVLTIGQCFARADDAETVKKKLDAEKEAYRKRIEKFNKDLKEWLEFREEAARKAGNKKLVDQLKIDQRAFANNNELPAKMSSQLLYEIRGARATLNRAYLTTIKEYTRLKEDLAAGAIEMEQKQFALESAALLGKRTNLSTIKPSDVRVWNNVFDNDASNLKIDGVEVPHSVFMHPNFEGDAAASYALPAKAYVFRAVVGVPKHADDQGDPACPLVFEVLGGGKVLWKSEPVQKLDTLQTCVVKVERVKTLTLRVQCPKEHGGAHAVWFAPIVCEQFP